jgi:cell division protein FtsA
MPRGKNAIVGIDIGTTKVVVLVAQEKGEGLELLGIGRAPSEGLKGGMVIDIERAAHSVKEAVSKAQDMSGIHIDKAWASLGGSHIQAQMSMSRLSLGGREVVKEDVSRIVRLTAEVLPGMGKEVLHVLPGRFTMDGYGGILNPIGMVGQELELEASVVLAQNGPVRNIQTVLKNAGVKPLGLVLQPLASADAILSQEEKDLGTIMVDIGGGTSDVMVYKDGIPRYVGVVGLGGAQITRDIATLLKLRLQEAERLKCQYGCLDESLLVEYENQQEFEFVLGYDKDGGPVGIGILCKIIKARALEILDLVCKEAEKSGIDRTVLTGLVLSGGSSELKGFKEMASKVFGLPGRIGSPNFPIKGPHELVAKPEFATGVGLLAFAKQGDFLASKDEPWFQAGWKRVKRTFKEVISKWVTMG